MTSQSPRIYTYKITFEEVPYYYYGVHKEKKFNEEYWGSPITHKWCWELYTPKKQILEIFDYSDDGYDIAQIVEKRIITEFLNDEWCLNENVGGRISTKLQRKIGKMVGERSYKNKTGLFSLTKDQLVENGKKCGEKVKELGLGIFSMSTEELSSAGKKGGKKTYELKIGIFSYTKEEKIAIGKKASKIINSQKWQCCETGYISTAAGVVSYQKGKGIDTSKNNRKRIL